MPKRFCARRGCREPAAERIDGAWVCTGHISSARARRRQRLDAGRTGQREFKLKTYWTHRWKRLRGLQLRLRPLCEVCEHDGRGPVPAKVVDHVAPHGGDVVKFWAGCEGDGLQSLCEACHRAKSARTAAEVRCRA